MESISVVIITLNEEKNIDRCIKSIIDIADEILVYDTFSTDKTLEICKKYDKVKVEQGQFLGYSNTKNKANSLAKNDWILSLDADEAPELAIINHIKELKKSRLEGIYKINRQTIYCGKVIKHGGWFPDWQYRLFNRKEYEWKGEWIHERLEPINNNKNLEHQISGICQHFTVYTIDEHIDRVQKYSALWADMYFAKGKKMSKTLALVKAIIKFLKMLVLKRGYKDGKEGWNIAIISAFGLYLRYAKLWQLQRNKQ